MDYSFFTIQVAIKTFPRDPLRRRLHDLIADAPADQSITEKRDFYKRFTAVVNEALPMFDMGFWDYVDDPSRAEVEFDKLVSETEGGLATTPEEIGDAHDEMNRLESNKDYVIVSMAFLLQSGGNADITLAERQRLPEAKYWTRMTFGHLIGTIPMLSFASVRADAVYVIPGSDEDGLAMEDILSDGWEYMRQLT